METNHTSGFDTLCKITAEQIAAETDFDAYFVSRGLEKNNHDFDEFYQPPGKQHYRLLAYLSSLFSNSEIFDIGTHRGSSAMALAYNPTNTIHTFDIQQNYDWHMRTFENIHFHMDNLFDREVFLRWAPTILACPFLFVDVDPHNGKMESDLFALLQEINYQGFVVWDDIYYFPEMRNQFWYNVPDNVKYDLTLLGHWSGTGVTTFHPTLQFPKADNRDWTLVTAYIDLTKYSDATPDIVARNDAYYLSHAVSTMSLPYNLIVYCEESHLERLRSLRPAYLQDRVVYRLISFDDLYFKKGHESTENKDKEGGTFATYREQIRKQRQGNPHYVNNRNTPSYYLFCMARYIMMKETVDRNPFASTHFGWINLCIERMGYTNLVHLDEALSLHRDKFSTCYIDYLPPEMIADLPTYFQWGRCTMCSGFFTGNAPYMWQVADLIENQFLEYLQQGYGHADEQLYSPVYFKHPDLFEHYYGDYKQMITNYAHVYEAPSAPIYHFIRNSFDRGNYAKCYEACQYVWNSFCLNKVDLSFNDRMWLSYYYLMSRKETQHM